MMKIKFFLFFFFPFFIFAVDTVTVTGIPWNSSTGKNSGYQIQSVPCTITFDSGDSGTGIKLGTIWLIDVGSSREITSDSFIGSYVYATSGISSPDPASATFSVSYGSGGSVTPDPQPPCVVQGAATEQTLSSIDTKLTQTNQKIDNIYNYWNSGDGRSYINDIWNATQYGTELLENIDSSLNDLNSSIEDLNSSLDDLYDLLDLIYTDVSDIKADLHSMLDLLSESFTQPSYERPEAPQDNPFGSLFNSMKSKIYPNYNFFSISGTNFPVWVFPFHLENYGGRYFEVTVDINKWQTVFGGIIPTICNFLRSLLKVLCAYYFFRVVNLTWRQF